MITRRSEDSSRPSQQFLCAVKFYCNMFRLNIQRAIINLTTYRSKVTYIILIVVHCPYIRLRSQRHIIEAHQGNVKNENDAYNKIFLVRCQLDDGFL